MRIARHADSQQGLHAVLDFCDLTGNSERDAPSSRIGDLLERPTRCGDKLRAERQLVSIATLCLAEENFDLIAKRHKNNRECSSRVKRCVFLLAINGRIPTHAPWG